MIREELDELLDLLESFALNVERGSLCIICRSGGPEWNEHTNDCRLLAALRRWGRRPHPHPSGGENGSQKPSEGRYDVVEALDGATTYKNVRRAARTSGDVEAYMRGRVGLTEPVRGRE